MLEFKPFKIEDAKALKKRLFSPARLSCETNIVNLLVWQKMYGNMYAVSDDMLFIKSGGIEEETYRLPFGDNLEKGIQILKTYTGLEYPPLWVQQGDRFVEFNLKFGDDYELIPQRDAFDYIYLQEELANLSGKKYHSKRNHISAFTKKYNWEYRDITKDNIPDILECAEKWYRANQERFDKYMQCEKNGIKLILENIELLDCKGGAIYIDGKAVAFTLGSPINRDVFDIHIEKALPEYATAYTVINNEFAKTLREYKYINREDDLGIAGLRKAKLSYKPNILLKKYLAVPKKDRLKQIYHAAFGEEDNTFEDELFLKCGKYCKYLEKDGRIVSICFVLPCKIGEGEAKYIFAVTTPHEFRGQGYAKALLEQVKYENDCPLILRPVNDGLIGFYKNLGFCEFVATNEHTELALEPLAEYADLAQKYKENTGKYTAMYYSDEPVNFDELNFSYSMP